MLDEQLYLIAYNDFAGKAVDEALWIKAMTPQGVTRSEPNGTTLN